MAGPPARAGEDGAPQTPGVALRSSARPHEEGTASPLEESLGQGRKPRLEDEVFSDPDLVLTPQEEAAIALAQKEQRGLGPGEKPVVGPDGSIRYLFGAAEPSLVCAVLQLCDVALQAGETVNDVKVGDPRWIIEPAVAGSGATAVVHLILKPADVGLETSLVVTTSRRTYHLRLRSHRMRYMPHVSFLYPEEALAKWDALRQRAAQDPARKEIPETHEHLADLSFAYRIDGTAPWKPIRVYNDGIRTVIQMPSTIEQQEAPTLLVVRRPGALLVPEETALVNYRVQGERYIVDSVFERAILIAGVGWHQERVTITRLRGGE
jgi:P-type conjugative transfer protein TrbG